MLAAWLRAGVGMVQIHPRMTAVMIHLRTRSSPNVELEGSVAGPGIAIGRKFYRAADIRRGMGSRFGHRQDIAVRILEPRDARTTRCVPDSEFVLLHSRKALELHAPDTE